LPEPSPTSLHQISSSPVSPLSFSSTEHDVQITNNSPSLSSSTESLHSTNSSILPETSSYNASCQFRSASLTDNSQFILANNSLNGSSSPMSSTSSPKFSSSGSSYGSRCLSSSSLSPKCHSQSFVSERTTSPNNSPSRPLASDGHTTRKNSKKRRKYQKNTACLNCHNKKVRCDGERPCGKCSKTRSSCLDRSFLNCMCLFTGSDSSKRDLDANQNVSQLLAFQGDALLSFLCWNVNMTVVVTSIA
jgi:hypothetical protein